MRRVQRAWRAAEQVLEEHQSYTVPVDVERLASAYAQVLRRRLDVDVSGALVPVDPDQWIILVNSNHAPVRQRFTIAHELGHLLLHGYSAPHADRRFRFRDARSSEGTALEEIQANQFAAELLMPRAVLRGSLELVDLDYAGEDEGAFDLVVNDLATRFQVSRQAMAIRLSTILS